MPWFMTPASFAAAKEQRVAGLTLNGTNLETIRSYLQERSGRDIPVPGLVIARQSNWHQTMRHAPWDWFAPDRVNGASPYLFNASEVASEEPSQIPYEELVHVIGSSTLEPTIVDLEGSFCGLRQRGLQRALFATALLKPFRSEARDGMSLTEMKMLTTDAACENCLPLPLDISLTDPTGDTPSSLPY